MKLYAAILLISMLALNQLKADDGLDTKEKIKLELAKQKLFGGKYKDALKDFNVLLNAHPNDGFVLYYVGLTYFRLKEFEQSISNLEKAKTSKETNRETYYYLGMLYQSDGKYDDAISSFNTFKSKITDKENTTEYFVDQYISQCNVAKKLILNPVDVKIENAGNLLNSKFDDKSPCISADGQRLVFTSRRPHTTDDAMDEEGDGGYFEDIYITHWDTSKHNWEDPKLVPGDINTKGHDAARNISPDGKTIIIYYNDPNGESRGGNIYLSKMNGDKWKKPEPINKVLNCKVNTTYWEDGACMSPDGKKIFFVSESPKYGKEKGFGGGDIWMIEKISKTEWSKPVNLGPTVNTPYQEVGIFLAPDGKTLFFCSNSQESMGDYDIFKTTFTNGKWTKPVNLGFPFNSERKDGPFVMSADHHTGYFSSERKGGLGGADIYKIDLTNYPLLEDDMKKEEQSKPKLSILKGAVLDGFAGTGIEGIEIKILNEKNEVVSTIVTDNMGEYFITLKGDEKYKILIEKSGFQKIEEVVLLQSGTKGKTFSLDKRFLLNKNK
ncbi:MAG: tetratricopeptide repeat protein [Bacteroidota bacterium]|jgi:Tol biopolymer transport system component